MGLFPIGNSKKHENQLSPKLRTILFQYQIMVILTRSSNTTIFSKLVSSLPKKV